jgi:ribosomal protein S18 acetylase RimI-like enzyme
LKTAAGRREHARLYGILDLMPPKSMKLRTDNQIVVREACPADATMLAQIGARTFIQAFGAANTPEDLADYIKSSFSRDIQAEELAREDTLFLVASWNDRTAGYAKLRMADSPAFLTATNPVELERFYVDEKWHGKGVSHVLMRDLVARSVSRGHDVIWLGVWERNDRAIAFYCKWGFEIVGKKEFRLGSDVQSDFVMRLTLGASES